MQTERPYALSIAGFDPSSGAGLSADIKTFESLKVYGLSVCTGLTQQTEDHFYSVTWREAADVKKEVLMLLKKYPVKAVKFGITPSLSFLEEIISVICAHDISIKIIVDPVWKSSTGFPLNDLRHFSSRKNILQKISLLTPNLPELKTISGSESMENTLSELRKYTSVLLKGGHDENEKGTDVLFTPNGKIKISAQIQSVFPKHGSGCVLSAAITAYLASGENMENSCRKAKAYTENFLSSNKSLLGFHVA